MTQERINKVFETDLGQQCNELFVTFDDQIYIRYDDAVEYLTHFSYKIEDNIETWYREY
jgi:hypothetical protein